jgi:hypothetical protein
VDGTRGARGVVLGLVVLLGTVVGTASASADVLQLAVIHEFAGSEGELCVVDDAGDPVDLDDPGPILAAFAATWPEVDVEAAEDVYGCTYAPLAGVTREPLATGDGFRFATRVPAMSGLAGAGYAEVRIDVCAPPLEVTTVVSPPDAARPATCLDGYRGAGVVPELGGEVSLTLRASDGFLLRRGALVGGLLAILIAAAAVVVLLRRPLVERGYATLGRPVGRWATGLGFGLVAGVVTAVVALTSGALDAVELRYGLDTAVAVALALACAGLAAAVVATVALGRVAREPAVLAAARRRGTAPPVADTVPPELADLTPPPAVVVPSGPWWRTALVTGPAAVLWACGAVALLTAEPGPVPVVTIAVATAAVLVLGIRDPLLLRSLRPEPFGPAREASVRAAADELGLRLPEVLAARVALPVDDDEGPSLGLWIGGRLVFSPVVADLPPRRALLLAAAGAGVPPGFLGAWFGVGGLVVGAWLDAAWGELAWWTLLPAALLAGLTLRWWWQRRSPDLARRLQPDELVAIAVEAAWWSQADVAGAAGPAGSGGDGIDLGAVWALAVDDLRELETEVGATPGTAEATARRLAAEHAGPGAAVPTT